jgi:hypothetical protein
MCVCGWVGVGVGVRVDVDVDVCYRNPNCQTDLSEIWQGNII